MKHPVPGAPSSWLAYVLVDDIAAATKKGEISLAAKVMKDVTEVMARAHSASSLIHRRGTGPVETNKKERAAFDQASNL